jgi:hypothetical protein
MAVQPDPPAGDARLLMKSGNGGRAVRGEIVQRGLPPVTGRPADAALVEDQGGDTMTG